MNEPSEHEPPTTPRLPPELRRAIPVTIAVGVLGLLLFLAGFAMGVVSGGVAVVVFLGAVLVAAGAVSAMAWVSRVRRP